MVRARRLSIAGSYDDAEKTGKKRLIRSRSSTNGNLETQLDPVIKRHGRKHRHSSENRCMSKIKSISNDIQESNDYSISSPKHKHRRCKSTKEVRFEDELIKADSLSKLEFMQKRMDRMESQLVKYKSKCSKMEQNYREIQERNLQLEELCKQRDSEYKELHSHYGELLKHMEVVEQEKINSQSTMNKISAENTQLNEDVNLLKILVYKLNVELERYQDKLRLLNKKNEKGGILNEVNEVKEEVDLSTEHKKIFKSWGRVNTHALSPLLEAYKENIEEKDTLIKQFKQDIDHINGKCKEIIAENEELRKDLDYYKAQTEKLENEIKTLLDDVSLIKEENDILTKQATLQKQKLHEIHSIYEKKVESMSQDNNKLHTDYINCRTELSNLQGKYEILNEGYEKLKRNSERTMPVSVHSDAIEECKRLFEELKIQYETEKKKLLTQLKRLEEINPENEKLIASLTTERDHLRYLTKNLEKNLKQTQHKLKSSQNALLSVKSFRDSFKRQLAETKAYCQELVAHQEKLEAEKQELLALFHKKSKENENIQYLGDNIVQRMGALKDQLKSVQKGAKEQLESVEKHIKTQEISVEQMKSDYQKELQRLKVLLKEKEGVIGRLQREKYVAQDNLELVWKAASNEDQKVKKVLKNTKIYNV
ncbi:protein Cep89 homolog isoform X2 [Chelonus insularis]|uniref:protein Cep89 homolog isoform X2 n=1 Tax=Chelonus insularis TaxID=460826 RepID=UPI00158AC867|nr:protein Cep89 homolog isoform X2 [Chelonus insularis]